MVGTASNAGLRRKAKIARDEQEARAMSPLRALRLATEKTADASFSLVLSVQGIERALVDHAGLLKMVPDGVLLLLLDGPDGAVGVMTLDAATLAALIEMQTVGQVLARPLRERPLTRTDAAMAAPLVDGILHRMSQHLLDHPDAYWTCGYRYGAMIDDRRSLGMALGAPDFHVFRLPLDIADGLRSGEVMLALPQRLAPSVTTNGTDAGEISAQLQERVLDAPVRLDAILCRLSLPLSDFGRLAVGDVLPLPSDALREIAIEAAGRQLVATGRLGKVDGMRALRLTNPDHRLTPVGSPDLSAQAAPPRSAKGPSSAVITPQAPNDYSPETRPDHDLKRPDATGSFGAAADDLQPYAFNDGPAAA
ncbi:MAG: hypothetical protein B7X55_07835 [Rhodobacterales bacterium 34-62-10]|nr:MAG: hypothetical protein B7X55_07835 [Rhodobacterales bacterium 34-62-10]